MTRAAGSYVLYGCAGCGSAAIEALLERAGADVDFQTVEPWTPSAATDALKQVAALALTEADPIVARVWSRNFKP